MLHICICNSTAWILIKGVTRAYDMHVLLGYELALDVKWV